MYSKVYDLLKDEEKVESLIKKTKQEIHKLIESTPKDLNFSHIKEIFFEKLGLEIKEDISYRGILKDTKSSEIAFKIYKMVSLIEERILYEDIFILIKRFPRMAIEKSLILKLYYSMLKNDSANAKLYKLEGKYFRGRLFEKNFSPYFSQEPYMEIVQPSFKFAGKGRFNEQGQSRFYVMNNKIGTYFECRKYLEENKNKDLFVQEFEAINSEKNSKIIKLDTYFDFGFYPSPSSVFEYVNDKIRDYHLKSDYNISNYIADIVNATSNFEGIAYNSAIFYSENNWLDYLKFKKESSYQNITLFSDVWDKEKYLQSLEYDFEKRDFEEFFSGIEGKSFLKPVKKYPMKLTPKDVIIELFSEEYFKIENWKLNLISGVNELKYQFNFDFETLFENLNSEVTGIKSIFNIIVDEKDLDLNDEKNEFIELYDVVDWKTKFYEDIFKNEFDNLKNELNTKKFPKLFSVDFSNQKLIEIEEKDYIGRVVTDNIDNFAFKFENFLYKDKNYLKIIEVSLSEKMYREILEEIFNFFHEYFGIYYKIVKDYENDSLMLINL